MSSGFTTAFSLSDYDLAATLRSGQAFRWRETLAGWECVVRGQWVRLHTEGDQLIAETATAQTDWDWLIEYLQLEVDLNAILSAFPKDDPHLAAAIHTCHGLRLLKQDPWETLAGFICSSNKQIVQIEQIIETLCARFGEPAAHGWCSFPTAARLAELTEDALRDCKMGYRAKYLHGSAKMIANGEIDLAALQHRTYAEAQSELLRLPGIGPKVSDCILLFAYGFDEAFPIDTWIIKALHQLYFPDKAPKPAQLKRFIQEHFAPAHGYAQQYLFHHVRTQGGLEGIRS